MVKTCQNANDPVDGSEIRPSPVEVGGEYPINYKGFIHPKRWLRRISEPSTVSASLLKLGTQKTLRLNQSFLSRVGLTSDSESKSS